MQRSATTGRTGERVCTGRNTTSSRSMSPAGSSLSLTARGLLSFATNALADGITVDGERYLEADTVRAIRTAARTVPPNESELLLGWAALPMDTGRITIASGRTIGHNAFVLFLPGTRFRNFDSYQRVMGGEQLFQGHRAGSRRSAGGQPPGIACTIDRICELRNR